MSKITIRRAHALSPERSREAAGKMAARLSEAFDMEFVWEDEMLYFQRSDLDGRLILGHKEVVIDVRLGFLLALVQPRIEQSIHEHLDKIFGAANEAHPKKTVPKKTAPKKTTAKKK